MSDDASATRAVVRVGVGIAVFAVAGALLGVIWEWAWTPTTGIVVRREWYADPATADRAFDATALYLILGGLGAMVVGGALVWWLPGHELIMLVTVCVGAALAGWLMSSVGHTLGPPDPRILALEAERGARLPGSLVVGGGADRPDLPARGSRLWLTWPAGALLGFSMVTLTTHGRGNHARRRQAS